MDKREMLNKINLMEIKIGGLEGFKGRADAIKSIRGHYDFLARHKTEPKIEQVLLRACERIYEGAQKKHKERMNATNASLIS